MKDKLPLVEALLKYHEEGNVPFSMPGNKQGQAFKRDEIGEKLADNLGYLDITEVDPLDNLHAPEGVIKEAQELLAKLYNVKKAYFLVNGSSGGNLASVFACFNEGDEVIVERNCHKSIANAIILRKLKVTYIEGKALGEGGLFLPPSKEDIYKALERAKNPQGIILTYPNYFGICYDIEEILKDLKAKGLKIIIDEAHGAHFGINEKLPKNVAAFADYTVVSAHKTLPSLTGSSYLLVNDESSDGEFYVRAFMTTSPSYLMMASLDYARHYLQTYGNEDYEKLISVAEEYKNKINSLDKIHILGIEDLPGNYEIDLSRYVVCLARGYSGHKLLDYLRENKIQCEMSFHNGVVLILSPCEALKNLEKLYKALKKLKIEELKGSVKSFAFNSELPKKVLEPSEVFNKECFELELDKAVGFVAKEAIIPYPPGIPVICPGEVIDKKTVNIIKEYLIEGYLVIGINKNKLKVIEKND